MDVPSIAYVVTEIPDGTGAFLSKLRLATARVADPMGPADWTLTDLDMTTIPCAGLCAHGQACIPMNAADPSKSVCKAVDAAPCPGACSATQACIAAACVTLLPPVKAADLTEGIGLFASLVRLPGGARAVVYYDREQHSLKLALESAGKGFAVSFAISFIDGNDPSLDVGQFAAVALAADGTLHVAYVDATADRLLYKTDKGGAATPMPEVVDDGARDDGPHPVGSGAALWLDGSTPRVVYQDARTAQMWQAVRGTTGWSKSVLLMGSQGFGFYPHVVSDGGRSYLVHYFYDRGAQASGTPFGALQIALLDAPGP
jgi:hypothetical protein